MLRCNRCVGWVLSAFGLGLIVAALVQSVFLPLLLGIGFVVAGIVLAK